MLCKMKVDNKVKKFVGKVNGIVNDKYLMAN